MYRKPTTQLFCSLMLLSACTALHAQSSPAKKDLANKVTQAQMSSLEAVGRTVVERPALAIMQEAGRFIGTQVPEAKREETAKRVDESIKKYMEESTPLIKERVGKLATSSYALKLEEKLTEDELKQFLTWLESPTNKKLQQVYPDLQNEFVQKLMADAGPAIDPKLNALQQSVRNTLNQAAGEGAAKPAAPAKPKGK